MSSLFDEISEDAEELLPAAFPVHVASTDVPLNRTEREAPQYGSCMTWPLPQSGVGQPVQILPRRLNRNKARLVFGVEANPTDVQPANPGAGGNAYTIYTATGYVTVQSITFIYTADATVGNRVVRIQYQDAAGNIIAGAPAFSAITASTTNNYFGFIGSSLTGAATGFSYGPLPNMVLAPGDKVIVTVAGTIGAADTLTAINLVLSASGANSVVINSKLDPLTNPSPQGLTVVSFPVVLDWESQQPCYAIAIGGIATVGIVDESYEQ